MLAAARSSGFPLSAGPYFQIRKVEAPIVGSVNRRHERYTAIVDPRRNTVAPMPWNALMTSHCDSPTRIDGGAVIAATRPTTATAPTIRRSKVEGEGYIVRERLTK